MKILYILLPLICLSCQKDISPRESVLQNQVDSLTKQVDSLQNILINIDFGHRPPEQERELQFIQDQRIRELRKRDPDHIYQVQGRIIRSEEDEFERRMEDYIEDNHDEIMDKYRN